MSKPKKSAGHEQRKAPEDIPNQLPSSPGDDPVVVTPKDVPPDVATARDVRPLPVTSQDPLEREDALLDEAIEETFPASDPIAVPPLEEVKETLEKPKGNTAKSAPARPKTPK